MAISLERPEKEVRSMIYTDIFAKNLVQPVVYVETERLNSFDGLNL